VGPAPGLTPLPREFYARDVLEVARDLLGAFVVAGEVVVRVTEVEAYGGGGDPASHAFRGPTARNSVMFGPPGVLYVYFTYGMHYCANVVTGVRADAAVAPAAIDGHARDDASAVLLRAGAVVGGLERARERRPGVADRDLARGPARLAKTLGLDLTYRGIDVTDASARVLVSAGAAVSPQSLSTGPRVGIRTATDRPWRLWVTGDPTVSTFRAAAPRRAAR